jgi:hypothetical protein
VVMIEFSGKNSGFSKNLRAHCDCACQASPIARRELTFLSNS